MKTNIISAMRERALWSPVFYPSLENYTETQFKNWANTEFKPKSGTRNIEFLG